MRSLVYSILKTLFMYCDSSSMRQNFALAVKVGYQVTEAQKHCLRDVPRQADSRRTGITSANQHAYSHAALINHTASLYPSPAWEQVMRPRWYESVTKRKGFFSPSLVCCALRYKNQIIPLLHSQNSTILYSSPTILFPVTDLWTDVVTAQT
jgi:hypothetical protein